MLDWDNLRFYLAIIRQHSLSAAARDLRVTQSTVGRRLIALEAGLGVKLFHRSPTGYLPTQAGETLLAHAERVEAELRAAERDIGGHDGRLAGVVRVVAAELLGTRLLVPCCAAIHTRNPDIAIELLPDAGLAAPAAHEADIAVHVLPVQQKELLVRRAGGLAFGIYASPAYLARRRPADFAAGCAGHRLIGSVDPAETPPVARWFAAQTGQAATVLKTASTATRQQAAIAGEGLACLPRLWGDAEVTAGRLQLLPPAVPAPVLDIWLSIHPGNRKTPRIRLVFDAIVATLRDGAPTLEPETLRAPPPAAPARHPELNGHAHARPAGRSDNAATA